jgi:hypothetical protein
MSARALAARISAVVLVVVGIVGGAILLALDRAADAGEATKTNRGAIERNSSRIAGNESKDEATRRCLTVSTRPQACIERVAGAVGPGGAIGRTGMRGARGLSVTGQRGSAGRTGARGPGPTAGQISSAVLAYCGSHPCGTPPSASQIAAAVAAFCADGACRGTEGSDGATGVQGPPPSEDQVAAAVAAFCADHSGCMPTAPADGVPGPQGPGPSDEQVQAAVDVYCASHNGCTPTPPAAP